MPVSTQDQPTTSDLTRGATFNACADTVKAATVIKRPENLEAKYILKVSVKIELSNWRVG